MCGKSQRVCIDVAIVATAVGAVPPQNIERPARNKRPISILLSSTACDMSQIEANYCSAGACLLWLKHATTS